MKAINTPICTSTHWIRTKEPCSCVKEENFCSLSTAEVEYILAASRYAQLMWINQQLEEYNMVIERVPIP